ncbi:SH3 domain-containing protein [Granulicella sibirica]|uniref:SH3b domain-containing protein n=1 Tax=Granulicella sibirica TaxID=2479048 RepID=A0A4Q0SYB8_9BACT|nr:SH3 domain-containing protein [Granulicella sibirica]RXH56223.1 hypothetical protein GRAN_3080 [Granulicella sibirica]
MRPKLSSQYVFVTAKQGLLRDRIAAVSNRTGTVTNGDKLEVLERGRRFIKVKTEKGEIGWIDEKSVATQETFDAFDKLAKDHAEDPAVASGVVRDEVYMHLKPGRETERFYRLAEGDKLKLIARATLPKALPPGVLATRSATPSTAAGVAASGAKSGKAASAVVPPPVLLPLMEDWWLVRDAQNRTGWVYSRMMDVDAPDSLTRYAEGQRFVGAYVLTTVNDPEAPQDDKNIPVFLTVLSPYKAGLAYDFDQVRLFTWNVKKHRYETGFREKNVEGYLPVVIGKMKDPNGKAVVAQEELPSFTYKVLAADSPVPTPDPVTGIVSPGKVITKTYRLEGNTVHRILAPGETAPDEAHPEPPPEKDKKGKKKKR